MSLGQRIKNRRLSLKITQQELAKALGLTAQHISAVDQDKRLPSLVIVARLAEELGVSIDYIVSGREGIIIDSVAAIKADKRLKLKAKRLLIGLIEELREPAAVEDRHASIGK